MTASVECSDRAAFPDDLAATLAARPEWGSLWSTAASTATAGRGPRPRRVQRPGRPPTSPPSSWPTSTTPSRRRPTAGRRPPPCPGSTYVELPGLGHGAVFSTLPGGGLQSFLDDPTAPDTSCVATHGPAGVGRRLTGDAGHQPVDSFDCNRYSSGCGDGGRWSSTGATSRSTSWPSGAASPSGPSATTSPRACSRRPAAGAARPATAPPTSSALDLIAELQARGLRLHRHRRPPRATPGRRRRRRLARPRRGASSGRGREDGPCSSASRSWPSRLAGDPGRHAVDALERTGLVERRADTVPVATSCPAPACSTSPSQLVRLGIDLETAARLRDLLQAPAAATWPPSWWPSSPTRSASATWPSRARPPWPTCSTQLQPLTRRTVDLLFAHEMERAQQALLDAAVAAAHHRRREPAVTTAHPPRPRRHRRAPASPASAPPSRSSEAGIDHVLLERADDLGRHLAGQQLPRLPLRRPVPPLLVLLRPEPGLDRDLLAPARDPGLPAAHGRGARRRRPHPLRPRGARRGLGRRRRGAGG